MAFEIALPEDAPFSSRAALRAARPFLSWALALPSYRALYRQARAVDAPTFSRRALRALGVDVELSGNVSAFPASGPLIVAANHPHGMLDGLVLADLVERRRNDVRVLANRLLAQLPELHELCLFVDPSGGRRAAAHSRAGLRAALEWLDGGQALIIFPAGEVAHGKWTTAATPIDSAWRDTVGRLALRTGAVVVPTFIEGRNGSAFYRAGRLHSGVRTLLLARQLLAHRGRPVRVRIGQPLAFPHDATDVRDGEAATRLMRAAVERLAPSAPRLPARAVTPVMAAPDAHTLKAEADALPADCRLLRSGGLEVFCAPASRIPSLLQEIGRLREMTFRAAGEGTGRAIDLDRFDADYLHLFVWNHQTSEVAGAYRIGPTDTILPANGVAGLYTSTLFRYDARLPERLGPAIELGRSFVRAEYQRSNALLLLWKGIARFVLQSGRYRVLFGPVSISTRYADTSQQLLRAFLSEHAAHRELAALVDPITPPPDIRLTPELVERLPRDLQELDRLVARGEADGKGIPVLLRQYLRLNARVLGFNVDPAFAGVLDALMVVDLADVAPAVLHRYFGRHEAQAFLARVAAGRPRAA